MITLFGATGFTGTQVAARLDRDGLPFRIAGRSADRLQNLSNQLSSHPEWIIADAADPQSIPHLFNDTNLMINCVGPFTDLGERVVRQAAVSGVHYIDSTNELGFVYRMQTYHRLAAQSGAVLVPSCAFEVALADSGASLLSRSFPGPYDEISVVYHVPGVGSSRGTRRSALRSLATSWITYKGGQWTGVAPVSRSRKFNINGKTHSAISIPSSESVTFPAHLAVNTITTWMTVSPVAGFLGPIFFPFAARFLRSIAGPWIQNLVRSRLSKAGEDGNERSSFEIQINMEKSGTKKALTITGKKPYEVTAEILVLAARKIVAADFNKKGLLPPSVILGSNAFFEAIQVNAIETSF
jgi:short subunit dehydrogenase-like uncharacterized protein